MATKKFTLLELHLDEGSIQVGPASLGTSDESAPDDGESVADGETVEDGRCPGRTAGKLLLALLALALLAAVVKKVVGGGDDLDELEALAELDEDET